MSFCSRLIDKRHALSETFASDLLFWETSHNASSVKRTKGIILRQTAQQNTTRGMNYKEKRETLSSAHF